MLKSANRGRAAPLANDKSDGGNDDGDDDAAAGAPARTPASGPTEVKRAVSVLANQCDSAASRFSVVIWLFFFILLLTSQTAGLARGALLGPVAVPPAWPEVVALPIATNPVFPKFFKVLHVRAAGAGRVSVAAVSYEGARPRR